ncbi:MAG: enoyl-CoA hydratase/isomerase family protein [Deltaproteobacteria bacterium]|nr:enoyl-CoA hydratase/isomerase family protein [Deltaproteobacteria bacterium]
MSKVLYEKRGRIAYVTLNRPETLNAVDDELDEALWQAWADFNADDAVDVAIVTGKGRAFCAGADLNTWLPKWEHATMLDIRKNIGRGFGGGITRGQHRICKPIIAAVNGPAVGGGLEIALACDFRIAAETAQFASFEVRRGLHQGDGGIVRIVAIAGLAVALDLALTGRMINAEEAYRMGLVNRVVPDDQLMATAEELANQILQNSQQAIRSAKETILDIVGRTLDDALRVEALNAYSSVGDFSDVNARLQQFYSRKRSEPPPT